MSPAHMLAVPHLHPLHELPVNYVMRLLTVQSDKLSSPVGSLVEGLNREPSSSELTFSARTTSTAAADYDTNATASQFRSPLLRQMMMGNKLAAGGRPTSASNDVSMSALSATVTSVSDDSGTDVTMAVGSTTQTVQPSSAAAPSITTQAIYAEDDIAVCDEPLEPSPRIPAPSTNHNITSTELSTPKPVPIEVWTEETAVDPAVCRRHSDDGGLDELCVEDQPMQPCPHPVEDICVSHGPDNNCASDSKPDPSLSTSGNSRVCGRDELCVDAEPSEPSTHPEMEVCPSGKQEEHTSVVDKDRDIDTTETLVSEMKDNPLMDTSSWNGIEKSRVSDSLSTVVNGYPDNDMRM